MENKKEFQTPGVYTDTVAELSKKLLEANKRLKEAENERTAMIENISHDLRAPLTAIRSAIDYFTQKTDGNDVVLSTEEIRSMLSLLDTRTGVLEKLVQELYLLTCIDSGREKFSFEDVPLAQFLEEYFFAIEVDKKYSDNELVLNIPEKFDAVVSIDVSKFGRVLDNLFTNAHKYSDVGASITLGAGTEGHKAYFYVEDTGWGIPKEAIPHIFERTYEVSGARTPRDDSSSGLGLAITKSIVNHHDGVIKCDSILGRGSRFTVYLNRLEDME